MGRYTDDLNVVGQAYAVMVRSPYAHGTILGLDTTEALAAPGVLAVVTGQDLVDAGQDIGCGMPFKNQDRTDMLKPPRPSLAIDKVRFVGDPVAVVVAETAVQAKDAAEVVELDIEQLPAVTKASAAAVDGALLFDDVPNNVALDTSSAIRRRYPPRSPRPPM